MADVDLLADARFTAEISTKMQVPDRIMVANGTESLASNNANDPIRMNVPDRIMVGGDNTHIASRSQPRELQLERSVLAPSLDPSEVRVTTPPRSIRLAEHFYPSATDEDDDTNTEDEPSRSDSTLNNPQLLMSRKTSSEVNASPLKELGASMDESHLLRDHLHLPMGTDDEYNTLRRQLAKMNHRLMSLELEVQQQQQRELLLGLLLAALALGKAFTWFTNRY